MYERAGSQPGSSSFLQLLALVTITGAIFLHTAPYIGLLSNTPRSNTFATSAEAPHTPDNPAVHVVARGEIHYTKPESATTNTVVQPPDGAPALEDATAAELTRPEREKSLSVEAKALPLPSSALQQGSVILTFSAPPLPVRAPEQTQSAISRSDAPPLPTRAPKETRSKTARSALQQTGKASWYNLDSVTASGEKMDNNELTAAHRFLPFGSKVRIENMANARSVVVRINDRGPFVAGRIIDLSQAAAEALDMIAEGVADVRLHVIYDMVASVDD